MSGKTLSIISGWYRDTSPLLHRTCSRGLFYCRQGKRCHCIWGDQMAQGAGRTNCGGSENGGIWGYAKASWKRNNA